MSMIAKPKNKQTAFEIFRALAVSMVLVGHFTDAAQDIPLLAKKIGFAFGYYGIPLFFIISGFLLTASLVSILKNKHCSFTKVCGVFLEKRFLRIYPAYLVSLIISAIYLDSSAFYFLVHFFNVHNLFDGYNRSINVVYWTLAVEFQWYLFAPLLIMLFIKNTIQVQVALLMVFILLSIVLRLYFFNEYLDNKYSLSSLVWVGNDQLYIHLYNFLIGVVLYQFRNITIKIHLSLLLFLMAVLFLIGYVESDLISGINNYNEQTSQYRILLGYVAILILAFIVFACLHVEISRVPYQVISFISLVSYSLYLYHLPILGFFKAYSLVWYIYLPVFLFSSIFIAALSYYLIEAPFLRYSSSLNRR
ncbi:hypothetical protein BJAS_P0875 [Bathymodiolus japonicus methanotrophic gill symbiont]|nr:hypothetical protein BJAS_P0875 [Bathymodiolus japonicus methanotrophic gill symbiont]